MARIFATVFNYTMVRSSVFYSRQRHEAVLPKYLALVAASGSISYAGIQYLHRRAGASPVSAKLLMESILFLANFAVQRFNSKTVRARASLLIEHSLFAVAHVLLNNVQHNSGEWHAEAN